MTLSGNEYTVGRGSSRLLLSSRSVYSMKLQAPLQGWLSGSATEYSYFLQTDCWNIWYLFPTKEGHCESSHSSKNYVTFFGELLNHLTKNTRVGILSPNPRHLYIRSWKKVKAFVAQSCPILCDPMDCSPPGSTSPGDSPDKNTGVGCHFLLQWAINIMSKTDNWCERTV